MQPDRSIGAHVKIRELSGERRASPTEASAAVEAATSRRQPAATPQQDDITFFVIDVLERIAAIQPLSFLRGQVDVQTPYAEIWMSHDSRVRHAELSSSDLTSPRQD